MDRLLSYLGRSIDHKPTDRSTQYLSVKCRKYPVFNLGYSDPRAEFGSDQCRIIGDLCGRLATQALDLTVVFRQHPENGRPEIPDPL
jgi:hypothetical protein